MPYPPGMMPESRKFNFKEAQRRLQERYAIEEERRKRRLQVDRDTGRRTEQEYLSKEKRPHLQYNEPGAGTPGEPYEEVADVRPSGRVIGNWSKDPFWQSLNKYQRAAAMSLLEADNSKGKPDFVSARNVLGAMVNRASKDGKDLGESVSSPIYEPIIHPWQYKRLKDITAMPEFKALTGLAEARETGKVDDWVGGATHFIIKDPSVMLKKEREDPRLYRSWRKWTGYDDNTKDYSNVLHRDASHAFLAPEGKHSAGKPLVEAPAVAETAFPRDAGPEAVTNPDPTLQSLVADEKKEKTLRDAIGDSFEGFASAMMKPQKLPEITQIPTPRVDPQPQLPPIPRTPAGLPVPDFLGRQAEAARKKARMTF